MARVLIFPSGNTFSHLRECEIIGRDVQQYGHDVHYGISKYYVSWADKEKLGYSVIPELWERGPTDHPNVSWFVDHDYVFRCIEEEARLIAAYKPDIVVADFKYTTSVSTRAVGARLVTKNILSMLPASMANFGYLPDDVSSESRLQRKYLNFFDRFACFALNSAAKKIGVKKLSRLSHFLEGEVVIIPDSPWFQKTGLLPKHYKLVSMLHLEASPPCKLAVKLWKKCDKKDTRITHIKHNRQSVTNGLQEQALHNKKVFLAMGSVCRSHAALYHLTSAFGQGPWQLTVSLSGRIDTLKKKINKALPHVQVVSFGDFKELVAQGLDLYICHGGLGSIYTALEYEVPTLVIPLQPEQDHNGMLVEFHGIGGRFGRSHAFGGKADLYIQTILDTPKEIFVKQASDMLTGCAEKSNLKLAYKIFRKEMQYRFRSGELIHRLLASQTSKPPKTCALSTLSWQ